MTRGTPSASSSPRQEASYRSSPLSNNHLNSQGIDDAAALVDHEIDEVRRGSPVRNPTDWSQYSSEPPMYQRNSAGQKNLKNSWEDLPKISKRLPPFQGGFNEKAHAFSRKLDQILHDVNSRSSALVTRQCANNYFATGPPVASAPQQQRQIPNSPSRTSGGYHAARVPSPGRSATMTPDDVRRISFGTKPAISPPSASAGAAQPGLSPTRISRNQRVNEVLGLIDSVILS